MFFSDKIPERQVVAIKDISQLKVVSRHEKYLGLSSVIGRKKIDFFHDVRLKVMRKISNLQDNIYIFFFTGDKEVIINEVTQAVRLFVICCLEDFGY